MSRAVIDAALATFGTSTNLDAEKHLPELDQARAGTSLPSSD